MKKEIFILVAMLLVSIGIAGTFGAVMLLNVDLIGLNDALKLGLAGTVLSLVGSIGLKIGGCENVEIGGGY